MNLLTPVNKIMSKQLITVTPEDHLDYVKELFEQHSIHHLPVVKYKKIVGLISSTDMQYFHHGIKSQNEEPDITEKARFRAFKAEDIMTTKLAKVNSEDPIRTVIDVFKVNLFHALPVVDKEELVGIITTFDIISFAADEAIRLEDY